MTPDSASSARQEHTSSSCENRLSSPDQIIVETKRQSSIVGHVDSLILMEHEV